LFDKFVQLADVAKLRLEHYTLMGSDEPMQSLLQDRFLGFQPSPASSDRTAASV
jgi:hypothetical protein